MNEEDVWPLLTAFASAGADIQTPAETPGWMLCRLPISDAPPHEQDEHSGQPPPDEFSSAFLPLDALLVLGWESVEQQTSGALIEKAQATLSLVAPLAGVFLANLLLCERVHELEAFMNRQALREREVLQAELLAGVSHELRTPLASIKGSAETLLRLEPHISPDNRREFLLAINAASDRLTVVIDRLLELAQLDAGTIIIERLPVNLAQLVREALSAVEQRQHIPPASREFTFSLRLEDLEGKPTHDEPMIQADRSRLKEVLDYLLQNAIDYSPRGGAIAVTIRPIVAQDAVEDLQALRSDPKSGRTEALLRSLLQKHTHMVELCVRDQGMGIPTEHLERIFDRFHRLDVSLTRPVNGLGIGLAICKRIVELHDGIIWAENEVSGGSAFYVWLPADVSV